MEQKVFDVLEEDILLIKDALKKRIVLNDSDTLRDIQYKTLKGINTSVNPGFAVAIIAVLEGLPTNLKANLPKNIEKKLTEMGLENKLKVQSNLMIETTNILKKEGIEMYESDFERMWYIKSFNRLDIAIDNRCCIDEELVSKEKPPIKKLLRQWKDKRSKYILSGKEFLVIKDFDGKLRKFGQEFQKYRRLTKIKIEVFVLGKEVSIGDMAWNIEIFLPEIEVEGRMPGAGKGLWELLTKDMKKCPEAGLSFEESVKKLNECVEKEEQRIDNAKIAEGKAMEGLNLLLA